MWQGVERSGREGSALVGLHLRKAAEKSKQGLGSGSFTLINAAEGGADHSLLQRQLQRQLTAKQRQQLQLPQFAKLADQRSSDRQGER